MPLSKFLDPKNDIAFRRIFGTEKNKDILIHFINDVLELKDQEIIGDLTYLPTIQEPEIAAKKQSIVDVLCVNEKGEQIIVEMQVSPQAGFEKRAQYYAAKAYSRQLNRGKEPGARYKDLKAVIFIAISDHVVFPDKVAYKSDHIILDKETYAHDLQDFSFTFIELPKFKITDISLLTDIVKKWCYFFKHADETSEADLIKIIGSDEVIERAYTELNQFNWTEAELITYEQEIKRIMDNQAAEDYKIAAAEAKGEARGEAKGKEAGLIEGKEAGLAEGKEAGLAEGRIAVAKNLLKLGLSLEMIAQSTGLTEEEVESLEVS